MRVLIVPDLHEPFSHPKAYAFLRSVRKQWKTDKTVGIGDEVDGHGWSRWAKKTALPGSRNELRKAVRRLSELHDFGPISWCKSNHMLRAAKAAENAGVPAEFLRQWSDVIDAPGCWKWADEWEYDGVRYHHGEGYSGPEASRNAALDSRMNTVIGHVHTAAGVHYAASPRGVLWGMSVGCLIDFRSPAFDYARGKRLVPVLGCGVVIDGVPHFIPFN